MARKASGLTVLEIAKNFMAKAVTANELRICQAVVFPIEYGMTTKQTASCIGRSAGWTSGNRNAFIKAGGFVEKAGPGGRKQANMTVEEEKDFLEPFSEKARIGGILAVREIHRALDERLGRKVALASVCNLLHRHDRRKPAPDKRHVKADLAAQEDRKKTPGASARLIGRLAGRLALPTDVPRRVSVWLNLRDREMLVPKAGKACLPFYGQPGKHIRLWGSQLARRPI